MTGSTALDSFLIDNNLKAKYLINDQDWQLLINWIDDLTEEARDSFNYNDFYKDSGSEFVKAVNLFDLAREKGRIKRYYSVHCHLCGEEIALVENPQKLVKKTLYCNKGHSLNIQERPEYVRNFYTTKQRSTYQMDRPKEITRIS